MPRKRGRPSKKEKAEREGREADFAASGHGAGRSQKQVRFKEFGDDYSDKKDDDGDLDDNADDDDDAYKDGQDLREDGTERKHQVEFDEYVDLVVSKFKLRKI